MIIEGRVHKFGDNIDTDAIIPAPHLVTTDPEELGKYCMEGIDPQFSRRVKKGDIVVAGRNFGCGSSREHAPLALKGCGISLVIASSFARIFYRNAINVGLPIVISPQTFEEVKEGDKLRVNLSTGEILNLMQGKSYTVSPFPPFLQEIINSGGLLQWYKDRFIR